LIWNSSRRICNHQLSAAATGGVLSINEATVDVGARFVVEVSVQRTSTMPLR
jgi:hypothetical protein